MIIKTFLFSCLLMWDIQATVVAQVNEKMPENHHTKIVLKDLDFKTVMNAFYRKQIQTTKIDQLDQQNIPYIGIKHAEYTNALNSDDAVVVFSPAHSYRNAQNELRFLFTTTEVSVDKNNHMLNFCGACAAFTRIYIFKKNTSAQFELLSQSEGENSWMNADFNYLPYPTADIVKNIRRVGPKVKAYVEEQSFSRQGYSTTTLYIVPFDENPRIKKLQVAEISNDNEVTGSEKIYNTRGNYRFLTSEHNGLYDIEIRYSGTRQIYVADRAKIIPVNETHVYHYNEQQQKYIRVK
ncbi:hypothetical protein [Acinetobacter nematophilus]|uniref:Uncharacterized protein n=1 Tax=Acinetobacter nematophilus TaxID=2994642 RepID=A0A9X3DV77_9GAMM|nr:hypothetical protein [Acinetobacter nematophilus]MCX5469099.1 hypothetical protein [Acinetobacter nematophilus]